MPLLDFSGLSPKPSGSRRSLKFMFGIGALVGVIALGSTLAASINLNGGAPVEFGQGVAQTTACDDQVTVTPYSTFANDEENADFVFTSFSVTGISDACNGKTFTIKAYKNGQSSPLDLYLTNGTTTYNAINVVGDNGNYSFVDGGLLADDIEDVSTGFKVTMVTGGPPPSVALASAQDVDRITIESSGNSEPGLDDGNYLFVSSDRAPFEIVRSNTNGDNLAWNFTGNEAYSSMLTTDANYLYWNDGRDIYKSPFANPSSRTLLLTITGSCWIDFPTGLAVDSTYIYYANSCTSSIGRAKLDGSERDDGFIVETNGSGWFDYNYSNNDIYGLYVSNDKIYWGNYTTNTIGRANIDGSNQNSDFINLKPGSFTGYDASIGGITGVTIQDNYIYWANWDISTIGRASLDGSGIDNTFISTGAGTNPYNITSSSSKLYWTNYGTGSVGQSNLDGSGKSVLFSYPFAIGIALYQSTN